MDEVIPDAGIVCAECGASVDFGLSVPVKTGCERTTLGYPCVQCGRVHAADGVAFNARSDGARLFFRMGVLRSEPPLASVN